MEPFNSWVARGRGGVAYETFARGSNGKAERQNYYDYGYIRRVPPITARLQRTCDLPKKIGGHLWRGQKVPRPGARLICYRQLV